MSNKVLPEPLGMVDLEAGSATPNPATAAVALPVPLPTCEPGAKPESPTAPTPVSKAHHGHHGHNDDGMREGLLMACETGDLDALDKYLACADKAQVLAVRDSQTWPLLAIAASRGHTHIAARLLSYGCPVDVQDEYGSTPLYRAVGFRQNGVVQLLLGHGADMRHINKDGNNIIHNSAYVCNDAATLAALRAGVDPTQPNAVGRISLLDMVENQPHLALAYLDSKVQRLANYVQHSKMLYDFTGLDYKDPGGLMDSPLEAIVRRPGSHFLLSHMLVKQYLQWQWRLYGRRHFLVQFGQHVALLLLVTYVAIASKYKLLREGGDLHNYACCADGPSVALDLLRAAAELALLPLAAWNLAGEVHEYRKSGHIQVRLAGAGWASGLLLRLLFRRDTDQVHLTRAAVVAVPRYLLDVWNLADGAAQLLIAALGAARVAALARGGAVMSARSEVCCLAALVLVVWARLLGLAGVFRTTGPKLRVLRRMVLNVIDFSVLYLLFFFAVSVALFLLLGGSGGGGGGGGDEHATMLASFMSTFQITLASAPYDLYEADGFAVTLYVVWTVLSTLLLLSLLVAILSYDFEVGVAVAEQEWLVVLGGYLLRLQRLLGEAAVAGLKAADLARCHEQGGFNTPVGEAKTNLPAAHHNRIPARLYVTWEDTTAWPPAFREQMERGFSYEDVDPGGRPGAGAAGQRPRRRSALAVQGAGE